MKTFYLILLLFSFSYSTLYYADGQNGSDLSNGSTWGQAWATLTYAETQMLAGDTCYIRGTFDEDGTLNCFYTTLAVSWIGVDSLGSAPIIQSASTSYVMIPYGTTSIYFENIIFDGEANTTYVIYQNTGSNNKTFYNCQFIGIKASTGGLIVNSNASDANTYSYCTFNDEGVSGSYVFALPGMSGIIVDNCTITLTGNTNVFTISTAQSGTLTFTNNTITTSGTPTADIFSVTGTGRTVRVANNTFNITSSSYNADVIYLQECVGAKVDSNTINMINSTATGVVFGIQMMSTTGIDLGACRIKGNTVRMRRPNGVCILVGTDAASGSDELLDSTLVEGNKVYGAFYYGAESGGQHGIEIGHQKYAQVRKNYVIGTGYGIVIKGDDIDWADIGDVSYNALIDCGNSGSSLRLKGVDNVLVANNYIYQSSTVPNNSGLIHITDGDNAAHDASGCNIKNNLLESYNAEDMINCENDGSTLTTTDVTNNVYWSSAVWRVGGTTYNSFTSWQAAGYDANSYWVDPGYSLTELKPLVGSIVTNNGVNLSLNEDYYGALVDASPNIGISESFYVPSTDKGFKEYQKFNGFKK